MQLVSRAPFKTRGLTRCQFLDYSFRDQKFIREREPWSCQEHSIMLVCVSKYREENSCTDTEAVLSLGDK